MPLTSGYVNWQVNKKIYDHGYQNSLWIFAHFLFKKEKDQKDKNRKSQDVYYFI